MIYNIPLPRVLDGNMHELRRLDTLHTSVTLSLEPLSTATLTLPDRETLSIRNWVELYTSMGSAGIFRVRAPSHNYRRDQKEYQLDHGIAEIGDYIIKDDLEIDSSPASTVIPQIFASYTGTLWQLGTIAATDTVSYNGSHEDVLSAILRVLADLPDYCLSINQSSLPWTLSVIRKPQTVTAEGRLARNIESCKISEDDQNLCTRIISPDLTGGKLDADTISLYGIVEHYAGKDDDTPQAQFEADCARYLAQHKNPLLSIQIDLLDLHQATGEAYDRAELGAMYRLALPDYNVTQQQTITKLNWPDVYGDPGRVKVTLANEEYTLSSAFHSSSVSSNTAIEKNSKETTKNKWRWEATDKHVTDQGTILHKAGLEIDPHGVWLYASENAAEYALGSSFLVQANAITAEVTRATAAEGEMGSRITQTADAITAEVARATASEGTLSSRITQTAEAITSEVTRATSAEASMNSRITQTADSITSEVTARTNGDQQLSSRITQTANEITLKANKVTVDALQTSISNLTTGATTAQYLKANAINSPSGIINSLTTKYNFNYKDEYVYWRSATVKGSDGSNITIHYLGN